MTYKSKEVRQVSSAQFRLLDKLGYLKDSNAAAHSVDSGILYAAIHLPARFKTKINLYSLNRGEPVLVRVIFMHDDASMGRGVTRDRDKKAHSDLNYV